MQVITLNKDVFSKKCAELISKIDFKPQLVVGILNGGGFVIQEIKNNFDFDNFELIKHRSHRYSKIKNNKGVRFVLKLLPYKVSNWLRILESARVKKSIKMLELIELSKQEFDFKLSSTLEKPNHTILIIDDAIDTGRTMFFVKNNLNKLFPKAQIKVAVIAWTIETSIVKPDYFIFKNVLIRFPWSKDYKGKDRF